jgi:hypothetical protein
VEENKEPTTAEDEDVEAHVVERPPGEDRDYGSEEPDVEGHLLTSAERPVDEERGIGAERPGEI